MPPEEPYIPPANRAAVISVVAASLTVISFCAAVIPVPLTGIVCYPFAAILGIVALASGLISLRQIHSSRERGHGLALFGSSVGGLMLGSLFCFVTLGILFYAQLAKFIPQLRP